MRRLAYLLGQIQPDPHDLHEPRDSPRLEELY